MTSIPKSGTKWVGDPDDVRGQREGEGGELGDDPKALPSASPPRAMPPRLHTGGRFRAWLGRRVGDENVGDRAWRRILHGLGALVLVYYVLPNGFFVVAPKELVLLGVLGLVLLLELLRHLIGLSLPTLRPYEEHRVASFAYFAVALVAAVLLFPLPIGAAVVLGVALVDPVAGETRLRRSSVAVGWGLPIVLYVALAFVGLNTIGRWPLGASLLLAVPAALVAVAVERPRYRWIDDDLLMTFVPAVLLYGLGVLVLGLPS